MDNPSRLVRLHGSQNAGDWGINLILGFRDTKDWIDAVAVAPYFGHDVLQADEKATTLPDLFAELETKRIETLNYAKVAKAAATKYGKRFITYEGGQHIVPTQDDAAKFALGQQMDAARLWTTYTSGIWRTRKLTLAM